jgi:C-terminal processing protease CtpA/Prc
VALDGYPTVAWLSEHRRVLPASNEWTRLQSELAQMPRGRTADVILRVRDASNKERTLTVPRRDAFREALPTIERPDERNDQHNDGPPGRALAEGIAYVDVERLSDANVDAAFSSLTNTKGLILDLRGRLPVDDGRLLRRLATRPRAVVARVVQRTVVAPCLVTIREAAIECPDVRESRPWLRSIDTAAVVNARIVALIDERTQGAMERFALSLEQMASVTFIGSASAGAVSHAVPLSLPGGLSVGIAPQEVRRADGSQVQRVGITPTIEVRATLRGLRTNDDDVIARAQQWLQQQLESVPRRRR